MSTRTTDPRQRTEPSRVTRGRRRREQLWALGVFAVVLTALVQMSGMAGADGRTEAALMAHSPHSPVLVEVRAHAAREAAAGASAHAALEQIADPQLMAWAQSRAGGSVTAAGGVGVPRSSAVNPDNTAPTLTCDSGMGNQSCATRYTKNPYALLPAWRWRDNIGLFTNLGFFDKFGGGPLMSLFATICFALASLLWWLMLEVVRWAMGTDLLDSASYQINSGFAMVNNALAGSGLYILAIGATVFVMAKLVLRLSITKLLPVAMGVILGLGAILTLGVNAEKATKEDPAPKASPAWLANMGAGWIDGVAASVGSGFGTMSGFTVEGTASETPSCSAYIAALYDQYYAFQGRVKDRIEGEKSRRYIDTVIKMNQLDPKWRERLTKAQGAQAVEAALLLVKQGIGTQVEAEFSAGGINDSAGAAAKSMATMSSMWQSAFLENWTSAQFGGKGYEGRVYCHYLEHEADISTAEQYDLAAIANAYDGGASGYPGTVGASMHPRVFSPATGGKAFEQQMFSWAACQYDGGWKATVAFAALSGSHEVTDSECKRYFTTDGKTVRGGIAKKITGVFKKVGAGTMCLGGANFVLCDGLTPKELPATGLPGVGALNDWIQNGGIVGMVGDQVAAGVEPSDIDRNGQIKALRFDTKGDSDDASMSPQAAPAENLISSFWGHNAIERLIYGFMALVVAAIYMYVFGGLAIGAALAQFGLVLCLVFLPITLLLCAWPSSKGSGRKTGAKLLRMTGGFMLSKFMLVVVMILLLYVINSMRLLIDADGLLNSVLNALIPLAALLGVRKVLQMAGVGDITSLGGALAMPMTAAVSASGDKRWAGAAASMTTAGALGKALGSTDAFAKKVGMRALKTSTKPVWGSAAWGGRKAWQGTKEAGRWIGGRYALPELRDQIFGRKDADGNQVQWGFVQRAKSLAGMLDMVGNTRAGGRVLGTRGGRALEAFANSNNKVRKAAPGQDTARAQMEGRRALRQALKGSKSREERARLRKAWATRVGEDVMGLQQMMVDPTTGLPLTSSTGGKLFGWEYDEDVLDAAGNVTGTSRTVTRDPARKAAMEAAGKTITEVTDPRRLWTHNEMLALGYQFEDERKLNPESWVMSRYGFQPIVLPVKGDANGRRRLVESKNGVLTEELADEFRVQYLTDERKQQILDCDPQVQAILLTLLEQHLGGWNADGSKSRALKDFGIDVETEHGRNQVRLHLAGQPSELDRVVYNVGDEEMSAMYARAMELSRYGAEGQVDFVTARTMAKAEADAQLARIESNGQRTNEVSAKVAALPNELQQVAGRHTRAVTTVGELETGHTTTEAAAAAAEARYVGGVSMWDSELAAADQRIQDIEQQVKADESAWADMEAKLDKEQQELNRQALFGLEKQEVYQAKMSELAKRRQAHTAQLAAGGGAAEKARRDRLDAERAERQRIEDEKRKSREDADRLKAEAAASMTALSAARAEEAALKAELDAIYTEMHQATEELFRLKYDSLEAAKATRLFFDMFLMDKGKLRFSEIVDDLDGWNKDFVGGQAGEANEFRADLSALSALLGSGDPVTLKRAIEQLSGRNRAMAGEALREMREAQQYAADAIHRRHATNPVLNTGKPDFDDIRFIHN